LFFPLVSVVIPAYNCGKYLHEAIDTVLAQTYKPVEVIVVDDGSTDNTPQILAQYENRIRCVRQLNQGVSVARNTGISMATGDIIALLDADDIWEKTALKDLVAVLQQAPDIGLVCGVANLVDAEGSPLGRYHPEKIPHALTKVPIALLKSSYRLEGPVLTTMLKLGVFAAIGCTVVIRKHWFDRVGGFTPGLHRGEDRDMWYRLAAAGCPMAFVEKVVAHYRKHRPSRQENLLQYRTMRFRIAPFTNLLDNPDLQDESARKIAKSRIAGLYKSEGDFHLMAGRYAAARKAYGNALQVFPRHVHRLGWLASFMGFAGKIIVRKTSRDSDAYWQVITNAIAAENTETIVGTTETRAK